AFCEHGFTPCRNIRASRKIGDPLSWTWMQAAGSWFAGKMFFFAQPQEAKKMANKVLRSHYGRFTGAPWVNRFVYKIGVRMGLLLSVGLLRILYFGNDIGHDRRRRSAEADPSAGRGEHMGQTASLGKGMRRVLIVE